MKTKRFPRLVCTLLVLSLLIVPATAFAGVGGVGVTDVVGELPVKYDQIVEQMVAMETLCPSAINVFTLAEKYGPESVSEAGRDLYVAKMGNGSRIIWIQAQIHGNEKLTTHALLDFMWDYAHDATVRARYAGLTIYAIPCYNVDGNIKGQRGTDIYNDAGVITNNNYDLNRDWKLNMRGEGMGFQGSETRAYYKFCMDVQPDWMLDLHHQGAKRGYGSSVNSITGSIGIALAPDGPTLPNILDGKYSALTKQMQKYIYDQIIDNVKAFSDIPDIGTAFGIDLYASGNEVDIYGTVIGACMMGLDYEGQNPYHYSCPGTFFETESQTNGTVPISMRWQKLIEQNYLYIYAFMDAQVTGDYLNINPDSYWDIPHYPLNRYSPDYNANLPAPDFSYLRPTVLSATPTASVQMLSGSQNNLTVTVNEKLSDKSTNSITEAFLISGNAASVYDVGAYKVYVETSGPQVIECYIVDYYTVKFVDWDGTVLKEENVASGTAATAPEDPVRDGYIFAGWDVDFSNIVGSLIVTANYITEITSIKIVTPQLTALGRGNALQIDVTVNEGASANYLVWSVSNPALATVDEAGLVTANHTLTGNVTVTAKSLDGKIAATVILRIN